MDEKDATICKMLAVNSRTPYREIGDKLGLSVNSVHKRVQHLLETGVIRRFVLTPSLKMLDAYVIMIFGASRTKDMKATIRSLGSNPNTYRVVQAAGNYLYVHGVLRKLADMERYISFVREAGEMEGAETGIVSTSESMEINISGLDYRIIRAMETDSRRDLSEVSAELGISTRTVKRRLERMLEANAVHPSIEFDPAASGAVVCLMHLTLERGADKGEAIARIKNSHQDELLSIAGLDNHPDLLFLTTWTSNMKQLSALQDSVQSTGLFSSVVPHVFYSTHKFASWKDRVIAERAAAKE